MVGPPHEVPPRHEEGVARVTSSLSGTMSFYPSGMAFGFQKNFQE